METAAEPKHKGRPRSITGWPSLENGIAAKGWTIEMFAIRINREVRSVEAWIYGEQKPTMDTFLEISKLINVGVTELISDCPKLLKGQ